MKIIDFENGLTLHTLTLTSAARCLSFSPDDLWLAAGLADGTAQVWDSSSFEVELERAPHIYPIHDVAFSPDSSILVTSGWSGNMVVWETSSWGIVEQLRPSPMPNPISFGADGLLLGVGGKLISVPHWRTVASLSSTAKVLTH